MNIRPDGTTEFLGIMDPTPNFYKEITEYKKTGGLRQQEVAEKPAPRQKDHLMDCLRYYISTEPEYQRPDVEKARPSPAWNEFQRWKKERDGDLEDQPQMTIGPGRAPAPA